MSMATSRCISSTAALASALTSVLLAQAPTPSTTPRSAEAITAELDALFQPLVAGGLCPGLVVGVLDGDFRCVRGYGQRAADQPTQPTGATFYEIGSNSKVFTGLLLADAVVRGVVRLDDPAQKFLPEDVPLPSHEPDQPILLWHLATHSSGLPRLPDMKGSDPQDPYAHFTVERLHQALPKLRVRRAPGAKYEYSNLGAGLLGHVLARAQGCADYESLLRERLCKPLGLADTVVALTPELQQRLAPPHDADGDPDHLWDLAALAGAGGIRSTVDDLLRFLGAQITPPEPLAAAVRLSQQKHHDGQNGIAMALGWHLARDGATFVHSGQTGGYHSYCAVVPSTRRAVCVLTNSPTGQIDVAGERLVQFLHGMSVAPLAVAPPVALERSVLARYVGSYRMNTLLEFTVTLGERGLSAQLTGQPALRIHPRSATEFAYRAVDASITFELDGETVTALVLHQNGQDVRCERIAAPAAAGK